MVRVRVITKYAVLWLVSGLSHIKSNTTTTQAVGTIQFYL